MTTDDQTQLGKDSRGKDSKGTDLEVTAPKKVPWSLALAGASALVLAPMIWLFFGHSAAARNTPPAAKHPFTAEFEQQLELSRTLLNAHRAEESLAPLARCKQLESDVSAVHNNLCVAYGQLERRNEAMAACARALQLDPNNQLAKNNLVWVSGLQPKSAQR